MSKIIIKGNIKKCASENYNYMFNYNNGLFLRWGKGRKDDPQFSPYGPEIADIEISTICHGINNSPCNFCYKSNTPKGENMTFETFKTIFHKLPKGLTQIAFGIGDIDANPDLFKILEYCRDNGHNKVIPNITINGDRLTEEYAKKLTSSCGAISVSNYDRVVCFNAVKKLTDLGHRQINIHQLLSEETYIDACSLLLSRREDYRLKNLNAIVFLSLKPIGSRNNLTKLKGANKHKELIQYAIEHKIKIGFDSCSAPMFLNAVRESPDYEKYLDLTEPCESWLFSTYIDVYGRISPCSFVAQNTHGINMLDNDFSFMEFWNQADVSEWRDKLLGAEKNNLCRKCPEFDIY